MKSFPVMAITAIAISILYVLAHAGPSWIVDWYDMDSPGSFGRYILTEIFPFQFSKDWGKGIILSAPITAMCLGCQRDDYIGFQATCEFYVDVQHEAVFTIKANNGFRLWLDTTCILSSWDNLIDGAGDRTRTVKVSMRPGVHRLVLHYYEWQGLASISFSTTAQVLDLYETASLLVSAKEENTALQDQVAALQEQLSSLQAESDSLRQQLEECQSWLEDILGNMFLKD